jgi:positive regulator of sigma E activity
MKALESLWYEVSPFVFVILGVTTALFTNRTGALFGALLMIVASWILTMRWSYRSGMKESLTLLREKNRPLARR